MKPSITRSRPYVKNIYYPPRRGFAIYDIGRGRYTATRVIKKDSIAKRCFTIEDCYAFLEKHAVEIVPDPPSAGHWLSPSGESSQLL
jgi:hypothetical protein